MHPHRTHSITKRHNLYAIEFDCRYHFLPGDGKAGCRCGESDPWYRAVGTAVGTAGETKCVGKLIIKHNVRRVLL